MGATPEIDHNVGIRSYPRSYPAALPFGCFGCLAGAFDRPGQGSLLCKRRSKASLVGPAGVRGGDRFGFAAWDLDFGSATGYVS
jgi:hypothetical protein